MKKLFFIVTFISITACLNTVNAQSFIYDDIKLSSIYDFSEFKFDKYRAYRTHFEKANSKGKSLKNKKKYKRIDFINHGKALYSTKVTYNSGLFDGQFPFCTRYYASNEQLNYDYNIENGNNILRNPMFYENGNFWNGVVEDKGEPGVNRFVEIDPDGNKIADLPYKERYFYKEHPTYGRNRVDYVSSKNPSYYAPANNENDRYYGYDHTGSYYNYENDLELTGFIYPTKKDVTNGSVLFMEDKKTQENYWVVIIDKEIKFKTKAHANEKPDILQLKRQTDFEVYSYNIATLVSHGIDTLNGYGVHMIPQDNNKLSDGTFLEVGHFKNGKLHGIGYRTKIVRYHSGYRYDVDAYYGLFENGNPKNTKHIFGNSVTKHENIWDVMPIEGFSHKGRRALTGRKKYGFETKINELKVGDIVYIESINRTAKIKSVNNTQKYITVFSDNPNIQAKITTNEKVYVKHDYVADNNQSCEKTIRVPIYKETKKHVYTIPAKYTNDSYTVKGVYYNKHVYESNYIPAQKVYKEIRYVDGYTKQVCPICNGTGAANKGKIIKTDWIPVVFN